MVDVDSSFVFMASALIKWDRGSKDKLGEGNWDPGPGFGLLKPLIPGVWNPWGPSPF